MSAHHILILGVASLQASNMTPTNEKYGFTDRFTEGLDFIRTGEGDFPWASGTPAFKMSRCVG